VSLNNIKLGCVSPPNTVVMPQQREGDMNKEETISVGAKIKTTTATPSLTFITTKTMNLRYNKGVLEQEWIKNDGNNLTSEWRKIEEVDE
jgi:hypothetical protein